MQTGRKQPSIIFLVIGALLSAYLGYLFAGAWQEGMTLNEFLPAMSEVVDRPFDNYFCSNTP